jgi:hypothetical protein
MLTLLLALLLAADADRPTVVLVVGAEGEPEFGQQFATWAGRWEQATSKGQARLVRIGGEGSSAVEEDRTQLQRLLADEPRETTAPLWVVLIGHGTFDGREAKFNLRGPDIADRELAEWLRPFTRPVAIINCASSSGPFLKQLAGLGRVVITATRSGNEHNYARFGDYISAAIVDPSADLDKDGQTSLLEAYIAAAHRTEEFYKQEARLATEHALLDDNGDGLGTPADWFQGVRATKRAKDGAPLDGVRAHQWCLVLSEREQSMPAELRAKRDRLELEVETLREKKASLAEEEYYSQLEQLLVELARLYEPADQP